MVFEEAQRWMKPFPSAAHRSPLTGFVCFLFVKKKTGNRGVAAAIRSITAAVAGDAGSGGSSTAPTIDPAQAAEAAAAALLAASAE